MDPKLVFQQIRQMQLTQADLKKDIFEVKSKGIQIIANGEMKFLSIELPAKITPQAQKDLLTVLNKITKQIQTSSLNKIKKFTNQ